MMLALGQLSVKPLFSVGGVTCTSDEHSPPLVLEGDTWKGVMMGATLSVTVTRNVLLSLPHTLLVLTTTVVLPVGINLWKVEPVPDPLPLPTVAPVNV